jgi:hypothetical protein
MKDASKTFWESYRGYSSFYRFKEEFVKQYLSTLY